MSDDYKNLKMPLQLDPLILFILIIESSAIICSFVINIFLMRLDKFFLNVTSQ